MNNNQWISRVAIWLLFAMVLFTAFRQFDLSAEQKVSYSEFIESVRAEKISRVEMRGTVLSGITLEVTPKDGSPYTVVAPTIDDGLVGDILNSGAKFDVNPPERPGLLQTLLITWGPILLLVGIGIYFMRQMQGGGKGGAFSFGKSKARMLDGASNQVTFADVAGCDEAKEEVSELVDFLSDPKKFERLGGRIPRGVLLVGPPGTGKTLLAKAIAGEARVPFFTISGSDFVEMFVGVGAARVRDMFAEAKKNAPCIIFIDEIDAVGRQRGAGMGGGNDEREQTLNQMLVEMDGFETNQGVIVIAATNRPDILDKALLRPGRFDRQVYVTLPDIRGREQILSVHMRKVPLGKDVKSDIIARGTPGFSGADLANLVNEAALMAARRNGRVVMMQDFEDARDKIIMGPQRKSAIMPEQELKNTAYHEAGHALVARLLPKCDPVHKVTIIPRGRALGVTMSLPQTDTYTIDRDKMLQDISMLFGGRIAEEVFMDQMTTGASSDFQRATQMARGMVTVYGMSDVLGPMVYAEPNDENVFARSAVKTNSVSEATMQKVDDEVRRIIDERYGAARKLIEDNKDKMHAMAKALLEWETIDTEQLDDIMAGRPPRPPSEGAFKDVAKGKPPRDDSGAAVADDQPQDKGGSSDQKPSDAPQAT